MRDKLLYFILGVLVAVVVVQARQGPAPAQAQVAGEVVHWEFRSDTQVWVMLNNGDMYWSTFDGAGRFDRPVEYSGNIFAGAPVPTQDGTWGSIKAK